MSGTNDTSDTGGTRGLGNTQSTPVKPFKRSKRARKYVFTLNNYVAQDLEDIKCFAKSRKKCRYYVGEEVAKTGTPHLQGYLEFKNPQSFESVKELLPRARIKTAKGSRQQNYDYCSKEGKLHHNFPETPEEAVMRIEYNNDNVTWKPWQKGIIALVESESNDRFVHWYWDTEGNVGKSYLFKYLAMKYNAVLASGKKADIFNQVCTFMNEGKDDGLYPKLILLNISREAMRFVNYSVIEDLKDGIIYSGKFEGGKCIWPRPQVIVFANSAPDVSTLSKDRWKITCLDAKPEEALEVYGYL